MMTPENDDSSKVLVQAKSLPASSEAAGGTERLYRIEFSFLSSFYASEPADFVARLEKSTGDNAPTPIIAT